MKPRAPVWKPAEFDEADAHAIRRLCIGEADKADQVRAMAWIIQVAADTWGTMHGNAYRDEAEGGARASAFLEGRRFVGEQIMKLANMQPQISRAIKEMK